MSTTFDVYPGKREIPTFATLLYRSTAELHKFLGSVGVKSRPCIHLRLQRRKGNAHVSFHLSDEARWSKEVYAWFMVGDVVGGTDAYFDDSPSHLREYWDEEIDEPKYKDFRAAIEQSISIGHSWSFRRSIGQPAIVNLAYGLIAASLAALTDGFVHSLDSAWDWERLPANPNEFFTWYFRPELAIGENERDWSARCIRLLSEQLDGC